MRVLPLIPALLLAACAPTRLDPGPPCDRSDVATVRVLGEGLGIASRGESSYRFRIVRYDDRPVRTWTGIVQVAPGRHVFEIRWSRHEAVSWMGDPFYDSDMPVWHEVASGVEVVPVDTVAGGDVQLQWELQRGGVPRMWFAPTGRGVVR